jgi:DNA mismatch repair protein MutS
MALIKEYFEKTKHYIEEYGENTVLLMQVGAFFEVYGMQNQTTKNITGSQIMSFSNICDLNIADKKICVGKENIVMAGFSTYMIDKYLKKLQNAGFTAVVYTQDEQSKNTTRSLLGIYSPGTYFSESNSQITNNIMCIWAHVTNKLKSVEKEVHVGIANVDIYTGKTTIFQFSELYINSPTTFDELERFVSIYNPSEVILIGNVSQKELNNIISYANIECKAIHIVSTESAAEKNTENYKRVSNCEKQTYQKAVLEKFFTDCDFEIFSQNFYENAIAGQAFCFVLDFIYQHNPNLVNKLLEPVFDNCTDRLVLANHSLKQLNIIDDGAYNGKYSSVEKLLNQCATPMGKRHFSHMLMNPTTNSEFLKEEYNITDHLLDLMNKEKKNSSVQIKPKLLTIKDISKITRQIMMKKISPQTIFQLHVNLKIIRDLYNELSSNPTLLSYFKSRLNKKEDACSSIVSTCDEIVEFLENNLRIHLCENLETTQQFDINFIKPRVDNELDNKTNLFFVSTNKLEAIRQYFNENIIKYEKKTSKKNADFIKLHETEKNNFSLIATKRRCSILKEMFFKKGLLTEDERENGVSISFLSNDETNETSVFKVNFFENLFFSPQTSANDTIYNNDISYLCSSMSSIKTEMKDLITNVYTKILTNMACFQSQLNNIVEFVTLIDVIFTKASIAKMYNYCKPEIISGCEKSFLKTSGLRHCLIEHLQQNELYVTNDVTLGDTVTDGILLYGTNAVGKTSLIRALGIATIMAQSGLYVPCSKFQFSPYKYIFTRILGNDNMFKNMSTFAVEMYELRTILRLADSKSLVLGDELCSGTESVSATSIFVAGIQHLQEKRSSFIFATHLHEIINYEEIVGLESVKMKHMAVVYDKERDLLIYDRKIKDGSGDNMYGLEVCKSLNLPADFITAAHRIRNKYHPETSSILSLKTSHFNSKKIVGTCEMCNCEMGTEVHHLQHQYVANDNGFIQTTSETFHKNHPANLLALCEKCHDKIHKDKKKMHKKVKTNKGTIVQNVSINF